MQTNREVKQHYKWTNIHPWQKKPPTEKQISFIEKHRGVFTAYSLKNRAHAVAITLEIIKGFKRKQEETK